MVLKKRLDYGFNGYKEPLVPRASRSTRVRRLVGKRIQDDTLCAFDLLATVAGKLLQENERSHTTHCPPSKKTYFPGVKDKVRQEEPFQENLCKLEPCDQGSCNESAFGLHIYPHSLNSHSYSQDVYLRMPSSSSKSYNDDGFKVSSVEESLGDHLHKPKDESLGSPEVQNRMEKLNGISFDLCCSEDIMQVDAKPPPLVSSDSSVELLAFKRNISYPNCSDGRKEISRDDDEKSSASIPSSSILLETFMSTGCGDRRIKKVSASNILKIKNTLLKDAEVSKTDVERQPIFYRRKTCYTRQRSFRCSPFKKKKIIDRGSVINPDGGVLKSPKVQNPGDSMQVMIPKDVVMSPSIDGCEPASEMNDSHVKLRIKSFKVPEFFIEIPETATIGSLKRTVTEAVTSILGGILQVGVLLRGKKLKDDSKTLLQTGIHQHEKLDSVSFMLETNQKYPPKIIDMKTTPQSPCNVTKPFTRYIVPPDQGNSTSLHGSALTVFSNCTGGNHVLVPSINDTSMEATEPDSRALVPICEEALTVVPLDQKPRQSEIAQRRIRRPFSVAEVEALVQAVEKLGTGRWRDVKLCAFDNAKHRTYVDLKDKWKTLVHTAKISPQQRRGEPVPQELLDRVLLAHSFWSQQQAKHQIKHQAETCHLL